MVWKSRKWNKIIYLSSHLLCCGKGSSYVTSWVLWATSGIILSKDRLRHFPGGSAPADVQTHSNQQACQRPAMTMESSLYVSFQWHDSLKVWLEAQRPACIRSRALAWGFSQPSVGPRSKQRAGVQNSLSADSINSDDGFIASFL